MLELDCPCACCTVLVLATSFCASAWCARGEARPCRRRRGRLATNRASLSRTSSPHPSSSVSPASGSTTVLKNSQARQGTADPLVACPQSLNGPPRLAHHDDRQPDYGLPCVGRQQPQGGHGALGREQRCQCRQAVSSRVCGGRGTDEARVARGDGARAGRRFDGAAEVLSQ